MLKFTFNLIRNSTTNSSNSNANSLIRRGMALSYRHIGDPYKILRVISSNDMMIPQTIMNKDIEVYVDIRACRLSLEDLKKVKIVLSLLVFLLLSLYLDQGIVIQA